LKPGGMSNEITLNFNENKNHFHWTSHPVCKMDECIIDGLPKEDLLKIVDGTYGDWLSLSATDDVGDLDDSVFEHESGYGECLFF
jgi:hypothetical protein